MEGIQLHKKIKELTMHIHNGHYSFIINCFLGCCGQSCTCFYSLETVKLSWIINTTVHLRTKTGALEEVFKLKPAHQYQLCRKLLWSQRSVSSQGKKKKK